MPTPSEIRAYMARNLSLKEQGLPTSLPPGLDGGMCPVHPLERRSLLIAGCVVCPVCAVEGWKGTVEEIPAAEWDELAVGDSSEPLL